MYQNYASMNTFLLWGCMLISFGPNFEIEFAVTAFKWFSTGYSKYVPVKTISRLFDVFYMSYYCFENSYLVKIGRFHVFVEIFIWFFVFLWLMFSSC